MRPCFVFAGKRGGRRQFQSPRLLFPKVNDIFAAHAHRRQRSVFMSGAFFAGRIAAVAIPAFWRLGGARNTARMPYAEQKGALPIVKVKFFTFRSGSMGDETVVKELAPVFLNQTIAGQNPNGFLNLLPFRHRRKTNTTQLPQLLASEEAVVFSSLQMRTMAPNTLISTFSASAFPCLTDEQKSDCQQPARRLSPLFLSHSQ